MALQMKRTFLVIYCLKLTIGSWAEDAPCTASTCSVVHGPSLLQRGATSDKVVLEAAHLDWPWAGANKAKKHIAQIENATQRTALMEESFRQMAIEAVEKQVNLTQAQRDAFETVMTQMDTVMNASNATSAENQREIDRAHDALVKCNTDQSEAFTRADGINDLKQTWESAANNHATCRQTEATAAATKRNAWNVFESVASSPNAPACMATFPVSPAHSDFDSMVTCVQAIATWSAAHNHSLVTKKADFEAAEAAHAAHIPTCHANQSTLEAGFCAYYAALHAADVTQSSCFDNALNSRSVVVADVQSSVLAVKATYRAAALAKCYLAVLVEENATQQAADLLACGQMPVNVAHLSVTVPDPPVKVDVDLTQASPKPCEDDWITTHYNSSSWHSDAPTTACTACPPAPSPGPAPGPSPGPVVPTPPLTSCVLADGSADDGKTIAVFDVDDKYKCPTNAHANAGTVAAELAAKPDWYIALVISTDECGPFAFDWYHLDTPQTNAVHAIENCYNYGVGLSKKNYDENTVFRLQCTHVDTHESWDVYLKGVKPSDMDKAFVAQGKIDTSTLECNAKEDFSGHGLTGTACLANDGEGQHNAHTYWKLFDDNGPLVGTNHWALWHHTNLEQQPSNLRHCANGWGPAKGQVWVKEATR